jgi:isoleucyl-tRNA synthetase
VTAALDDFDPPRAGRRLAEYLDDLSNWYVRRSRRRFWRGPVDPAAAAGFATLHECLQTLTRLLAPFIPFLTDYLWEVLGPADGPDSVHLAGWPSGTDAWRDDRLAADMARVRRLVELGRTAAAGAGRKLRQPLGRALVAAPAWSDTPEELRRLLAEELNVAAVEELAAASGELIDYAVAPNFRSLGRRFGRRTPDVAAAITAADPASVAAALRAAGTVEVAVGGEPVQLGPDDVVVTETPRADWAVASAGAETVALDLTLTEELRRAGTLREVIRLVQETRKATGLDVSDRIELWWSVGSGRQGAPGGVDPQVTERTAAALREGAALLAEEVLAVSVTAAAPAAPVTRHEVPELGLTFWLRPVG